MAERNNFDHPFSRTKQMMGKYWIQEKPDATSIGRAMLSIKSTSIDFMIFLKKHTAAIRLLLTELVM
ncbi:hypothetical protein PR048_009390 [Dryococelus australis]|uniref:Uncharacterized protein n=1 Tax=Dryococelus australis TaxID=614101 RepID=A0ABQ9I0U6_9NEOP|nr:hypothetical protein PR048_009390 [Dryococelus australis]